MIEGSQRSGAPRHGGRKVVALPPLDHACLKQQQPEPGEPGCNGSATAPACCRYEIQNVLTEGERMIRD